MILTPDVLYMISSFIREHPSKITSESVKNCAREITELALTNSFFYTICQKDLAQLKEINRLVNKYDVYNEDFATIEQHELCFNASVNPRNSGYNITKVTSEFLQHQRMIGNPQLLDALSSNCNLPCAINSRHKFCEEDVRKIIELTPQSIVCNIGYLRCREFITPFVMACFNVNIPLHIIEFLLQKGADPHLPYLLNNRQVPLLKDLEKNSAKNSARFLEISKLIQTYTNKPSNIIQ